MLKKHIGAFDHLTMAMVLARRGDTKGASKQFALAATHPTATRAIATMEMNNRAAFKAEAAARQKTKTQAAPTKPKTGVFADEFVIDGVDEMPEEDELHEEATMAAEDSDEPEDEDEDEDAEDGDEDEDEGDETFEATLASFLKAEQAKVVAKPVVKAAPATKKIMKKAKKK